MKIVIDGNIGCGKTTVIKRLNDDLRIPIFLEPLHKWNELLSLFYEEPSKWAFPFNLEVMTGFNDWKRNSFPAIYERSPLSCRNVFTELNYESGHIHPLELKIFDKIYNELSWMPDMVIYIQTDPTVCASRMQERGRDCEKGVGLDYITKVHDKYEKMVKLPQSLPITHIVDGNKDKDQVFETVKALVEKALAKHH
jgi:deoxyadenosine/deoxycytidine kinase